MKKMQTIGKWMIPAAAALLPFVVLAAPLAPVLPPGQALDLTQIETLIKGIANFLIIVSMVIAIIFIIYGGIRWVSARGSEDALKAAKAIVLNGIIGALIILATGVILQTLAGVVTRQFFQ